MRQFGGDRRPRPRASASPLPRTCPIHAYHRQTSLSCRHLWLGQRANATCYQGRRCREYSFKNAGANFKTWSGDFRILSYTSPATDVLAVDSGLSSPQRLQPEEGRRSQLGAICLHVPTLAVLFGRHNLSTYKRQSSRWERSFLCKRSGTVAEQEIKRYESRNLREDCMLSLRGDWRSLETMSNLTRPFFTISAER